MMERVITLRRQGDEKVLRYQEKFSNHNVCGWWYPGCGTDRGLKPDWDKGFVSMTSSLAPVFCCFDQKGDSCILVACQEVREKVWIRCGIEEETGAIHFRLEIPLGFYGDEDYSTRLFLSVRREPYERAIARAVSWWETELGLVGMPVPPSARLPMYSTWYSYHQEMSGAQLECECAIARELGMETVIVDDGWQTEDVSRGYAYCGDWQVCKGKFPDLRQHVRRVHEQGMNYMMWLSVPFVGISSGVWEAYQDKLLTFLTHQKAGVLDPRYPQVREFVRKSCCRLVEEYDIDGLKLDFIDEFYQRQPVDETAVKPGMDFYSVQDAVDCMMKEIAACLQQLKNGFLIEFRQNYIGPNMRKYGNIFRVDDCPGAWISNRIGLVDLRLLSGGTAVHSDMIMWPEQAEPWEAAVHLINSIWGTLQISVRLETLSMEMKETLRFWLGFARTNREVLQEGALKAHDPLNLYPVVESSLGGVWVAAVYEAQRGIEIPPKTKEGWILYAAGKGKLYLENSQGGRMELLDCRGRKMGETMGKEAVMAVPLEPGMLVHFYMTE